MFINGDVTNLQASRHQLSFSVFDENFNFNHLVYQISTVKSIVVKTNFIACEITKPSQIRYYSKFNYFRGFTQQFEAISVNPELELLDILDEKKWIFNLWNKN